MIALELGLGKRLVHFKESGVGVETMDRLTAIQTKWSGLGKKKDSAHFSGLLLSPLDTVTSYVLHSLFKEPQQRPTSRDRVLQDVKSGLWQRLDNRLCGIGGYSNRWDKEGCC